MLHLFFFILGVFCGVAALAGLAAGDNSLAIPVFMVAGISFVGIGYLLPDEEEEDLL